MTQPVAPRWLWLAHGSPAVALTPIAPSPCCLCGCSATHKSNLRDTFNDLDSLAAPESPAICTACAWYCDHSRAMRAKSWVATPASARCWERATMRADLAGWLATGLTEDTCLCVAPNQAATQKHTHILRAPVNAAGSRQLTIQIAEGRALLTPDSWTALLAAMDALIALGHRRTEILSGSLNTWVLAQHGQIATAQAHMRTLVPWQGGPELQLASYATPQPKEARHD